MTKSSNPQETADLATLTEESLNGKSLCATKANVRNGEGNRFVAQLFDSPLIYLATDNLFLEISEKFNLCYNYKKEPHPLHRRIYVTSKLEKQPLRDVSYTENCFH